MKKIKGKYYDAELVKMVKAEKKLTKKRKAVLIDFAKECVKSLNEESTKKSSKKSYSHIEEADDDIKGFVI